MGKYFFKKYLQETVNRRILYQAHGAERDARRETNHKRKNDAKNGANDPKNAAGFKKFCHAEI